MEEVDNIILVSLRQLGLKVPENVVGLKQFDSDLFFTAVVRFMGAIDPDKKLPTALPKETARGYRVCEALAKAVEGVGYPSSSGLGFDNFLYPNEHDMRKLLAFLMELLPQHEDDHTEVVDSHTLFRQQLSKSLMAWRDAQHSYRPPALAGSSVRKTNCFTATRLVVPSPKTDAGWRESMRIVTAQVFAPQNIVGSIFEMGALDQLEADAKNRLQFAADDGVAEKQRKRAALQKVIANALADHRTGASNTASGSGDADGSGKDGDKGQDTKTGKGVASLAELLQEAYGSSSAAAGRSTAFEHTTTFTQQHDDHSTAISAPAQSDDLTQTDTTSSAAAAASGAGGADAADAPPEPPKMTEKERLEKERRERREKLEAEAKAKQEALQTQLDELVASQTTLETRTQTLTQSLAQLQAQLDEEEQGTAILEEEYTTHKQSIQMIDNFEENVKSLMEIINASGDRLVKLAEEWEKHRAPMLQVYRDHKKQLTQRKTECRIKLEKIKEMRLEMKEMIQQLHEKDQLTAKLAQDVAALPKSVSRNAYTVRILEIVKNVKKQHVDINNILRDIRDVQKEISQVEDTLKRSHTSADEAVYGAAKGDAALKAAYKLFVDLHADFTQLIESVEGKGRATSDIRQLELKSGAISAQNHSLNFDKVMGDLEKVRKENEALAARLRGN